MRPEAESTEMSDRAAKKAVSASSCAICSSSGRAEARASSLAATMVATCLAIWSDVCDSIYWWGSAKKFGEASSKSEASASSIALSEKADSPRNFFATSAFSVA